MLTLQEAKDKRSKKINKIENIKEPIEANSAIKRLEAISKTDLDNISKDDLAFFLKCFGYFIKDGDFMLRVRIPGGKLSATQAKKIGEVAKNYGNDYIDLTTRMQVELRYIKVEDLATVVKELDSVGVTTYQTGIDNLRNIVTDPLDAVALDSIIHTQPILDEMQDIFLKKEEYIGTLPRKFNTAILGSMSNSCNIYGHDCSFILAQNSGVWGFNLYLGGKVAKQAVCANCFVTANEVPILFRAIVDTFKEYGYRDNRNKNRLHYLLQDVGIENFMDEVYSRCDLVPKGAGVTMVQSRAINYNTNRVLTKDGNFAFKLIVPSGIFSGSDMIEASNLSLECGSGELRVSYDQNLWILGVSDCNDFLKKPLYNKYSAYNNIYFSDMIACAGTQTCNFGVIKNKPDAIEMSHYLNEEVPLENGVVRINWSACPKGCGVHGIGDIGLEGCKAKDRDGNRVDGVHIFIGGKITHKAKEARVLQKSVPLSEARVHIKYLLKVYAEYKEFNESFEEFESRYFSNFTLGALSFFTKVNFVLEEAGLSEFKLDKEPKTFNYEELEVFNFGLQLFKQLTAEKRFEGVNGLEIIEKRPRKLKEGEVSKLNSKVPLNLSKAIEIMTHENRNKRAKVFTEILTILNDV